MERKKWETLSSTYLCKRPWLTARRDTVKMSNGVINDEYYVLEYPTWVNVIARTTDGLFIMVEQYRYAWGDYFIELCAGVAEPGEDPETAARRELAEETGYTGGKWRLLSVISANPGSHSNRTYCFVAEGVSKTTVQHLDETEDLNVKLLTRAELAQLLKEDKLKQALMIAPLLRYFFEDRLDAMADE